MFANIGQYFLNTLIEGAVIGFIFWILIYITFEGTSLWPSIRTGILSELIGNLPYLAAMPAFSPTGIFMTVLAAGIFVKLILEVGELTLGRAAYGILTTYFFLTAIVACS